MAQLREDFKHLFASFLFRDFKYVLKCFTQWENFLNLSHKRDETSSTASYYFSSSHLNWWKLHVSTPCWTWLTSDFLLWKQGNLLSYTPGMVQYQDEIWPNILNFIDSQSVSTNAFFD